MGPSPSLSPWSSLRFRRARDERGWALLGIPQPLYPRVMQRLFEQQAKFIKKHDQGNFVSILFEAPVPLAARLALTFPAPMGSEPLSINDTGDRILYGKAACSPKAQRQAEATGPDQAELAQQDEFWKAVLAQVAADHHFDPIALDPPPPKPTAPDPIQSEIASGPNQLDPDDDEGWEEDYFEPASTESVPQGEDSSVSNAEDSEPDWEDVWIESEAEALHGATESEPIEPKSPESIEPIESEFIEPELIESEPVEPKPTAPETIATLETKPDEAEADPPTLVRQEPFPPLPTEGAAAEPPNHHPITPTAVGKVLGNLTIEEAMAQDHARPPTSLSPPRIPPAWKASGLAQGKTIAALGNTAPPTQKSTQPPPQGSRQGQASSSEPKSEETAQLDVRLLQGDHHQINFLLYEGVEAWNHWRSRYPDVYPNLRGAYLNHLDLRWVDLHGADLRFAFLFYADLMEADLYGASLKSADLIHANLEAADLRCACLSETYLSYANLSHADLRGADLRGAFLHGANLTGTFLPKSWPDKPAGKPAKKR